MVWFLVAFISGFILDYLWVQCVDAVATKCPLRAANLSILIYVCTFVPTVLIIDKNVMAVIAYVVGGWIGTYISVSRSNSCES